ncbi:MAG: hypothetical protein Q8Q81_03770 [Oxalobacteraceae bacterium]|nr:hypothetical protein [Oxalobacteraceae bacterium]
MSQQFAWWLNQIGIIVEICGGGYLVFRAWRSKHVVAGMKTDMDSIEHSVEALLREIRGNFSNQRLGFILLVLGLLMQLASNGFEHRGQV